MLYHQRLDQKLKHFLLEVPDRFIREFPFKIEEAKFYKGFPFTLIKKKERCAVPQRGQIKSKGNSLIKKKERYAVPHGGQINL